MQAPLTLDRLLQNGNNIASGQGASAAPWSRVQTRAEVAAPSAPRSHPSSTYKLMSCRLLGRPRSRTSVRSCLIPSPDK